MTDDEAHALGRRLVACKGFHVLPGMRDMQGRYWVPSELFYWWNEHHTPDVRDPATLGCLLALVRDAYKRSDWLWEGRVEVRQENRYLFVVERPVMEDEEDGCLRYRRLAHAKTEAEALVRAFETAPHGMWKPCAEAAP